MRPSHVAAEIREVEGAWGPSFRDKQLVAIRAANAKRWTPEERAKQSEQSLAYHSGMTPEERTEHGRRISVGRRKSA
jgi:hypothetical protein